MEEQHEQRDGTDHTERAALARADILDAFASFLRLNVAQGDARR